MQIVDFLVQWLIYFSKCVIAWRRVNAALVRQGFPLQIIGVTLGLRFVHIFSAMFASEDHQMVMRKPRDQLIFVRLD